MSVQTVSADCLWNGRDYGPLLRELSAGGRVPADIRPGHGYYNEDNPLRLLEKSFWCAREAERCRLLGTVCGTVCYEPRPCVAMRQRWLDEIDRLSQGRFPVRIDLPHALRVLPRVDADGKTDSVTILNLSVGDTDEFQVRVRNPKGCTAPLASPRGEREARAVYDAPGDELTVTIPNLGGWQIATLFL